MAGNLYEPDSWEADLTYREALAECIFQRLNSTLAREGLTMRVGQRTFGVMFRSHQEKVLVIGSSLKDPTHIVRGTFFPKKRSFDTISIEPINFIRDPDFFGGKPYRRKVVFGGDDSYGCGFNIWVTLQGGGRLRTDYPNGVSLRELAGLAKSLPCAYIGPPTREWIQGFLARYNRMSDEERKLAMEASYRGAFDLPGEFC